VAVQVAEVTELRGTTTRQDGEVRQLRAHNQELGQKAALVAVLTAEAAALKAQVRTFLTTYMASATSMPVLWGFRVQGLRFRGEGVKPQP
jgi:hypothetical protein